MPTDTQLLARKFFARKKTHTTTIGDFDLKTRKLGGLPAARLKVHLAKVLSDEGIGNILSVFGEAFSNGGANAATLILGQPQVIAAMVSRLFAAFETPEHLVQFLTDLFANTEIAKAGDEDGFLPLAEVWEEVLEGVEPERIAWWVLSANFAMPSPTVAPSSDETAA